MFTLEELALISEQLKLAVRNRELYGEWNDVAKSAIKKCNELSESTNEQEES